MAHILLYCYKINLCKQKQKQLTYEGQVKEFEVNGRVRPLL